MRTVFFVLVLFITSFVSAQEVEKKISNDPKSVASDRNVTVTATPASTVALNERSTDPANPTPEEQGYTKKTIGGKEVYVKEAGQMIFYYEPKK